jgi:cytochrome c oxidase assembly protein subunit 15
VSDPAAGYDLAPLLGVAALGLAIALAPLAWFWSQRRHAAPAARLRALALLVLFLCFDLVLLGAFTRSATPALAVPTGPAATATRARSAPARTSPRRRRPCPPVR